MVLQVRWDWWVWICGLKVQLRYSLGEFKTTTIFEVQRDLWKNKWNPFNVKEASPGQLVTLHLGLLGVVCQHHLGYYCIIVYYWIFWILDIGYSASTTLDILQLYNAGPVFFSAKNTEGMGIECPFGQFSNRHVFPKYLLISNFNSLNTSLFQISIP